MCPASSELLVWPVVPGDDPAGAGLALSALQQGRGPGGSGSSGEEGKTRAMGRQGTGAALGLAEGQVIIAKLGRACFNAFGGSRQRQ